MATVTKDTLVFKATDKGSLKKVNSGLKAVQKSTDDLVVTVPHLQKAMADFSRQSVKGFKQIAYEGNIMQSMYARIASTMFAVTSGVRLFQSAADFGILTKSIEEFSARSGTSITRLVKDMKDVTQGAVDFNTIMKSATLGTSAGLSAKVLKDLTKAATDASRAMGVDLTDAMNRIFRGVIKAEPELLDELGIILRLTTASEKYAAKIGKTANSLTTFEKQVAVANEVLAQAEQKFGGISESVPVNELSRLTAVLKDTGLESLNIVLQALNPIFKLVADNVDLLAGYFAKFALTGLASLTGMSKGMVTFGETARKSMNTAKVAMAEFRKEPLLLNTAKLKTLQSGPQALLSQLQGAIKGGAVVGTEIAGAVAKGMQSTAARKKIENSLQKTLDSVAKSTKGTVKLNVFDGSGIQAPKRQVEAMLNTLRQLDEASLDSVASMRKLGNVKGPVTLASKLTAAKVAVKGFAVESKVAFATGRAAVATSGMAAGLSAVSASAGLASKAVTSFGVAVGFMGKAIATWIPQLAIAITAFQLLSMWSGEIKEFLGLGSKAAEEYGSSIEALATDIDQLNNASKRAIDTQNIMQDGLAKTARIASFAFNQSVGRLDLLNNAYSEFQKLKKEDIDSEVGKATLQTIANIISGTKSMSKASDVLTKAAKAPGMGGIVSAFEKISLLLEQDRNAQQQAKEAADGRLKAANDLNTILAKASGSYMPSVTAEMTSQVALQRALNDAKDTELSIASRAEALGSKVSKPAKELPIKTFDSIISAASEKSLFENKKIIGEVRKTFTDLKNGVAVDSKVIEARILSMGDAWGYWNKGGKAATSEVQANLKALMNDTIEYHAAVVAAEAETSAALTPVIAAYELKLKGIREQRAATLSLAQAEGVLSSTTKKGSAEYWKATNKVLDAKKRVLDISKKAASQLKLENAASSIVSPDDSAEKAANRLAAETALANIAIKEQALGFDKLNTAVSAYSAQVDKFKAGRTETLGDPVAVEKVLLGLQQQGSISATEYDRLRNNIVGTLKTEASLQKRIAEASNSGDIDTVNFLKKKGNKLVELELALIERKSEVISLQNRELANGVVVSRALAGVVLEQERATSVLNTSKEYTNSLLENSKATEIEVLAAKTEQERATDALAVAEAKVAQVREAMSQKLENASRLGIKQARNTIGASSINLGLGKDAYDVQVAINKAREQGINVSHEQVRLFKEEVALKRQAAATEEITGYLNERHEELKVTKLLNDSGMQSILISQKQYEINKKLAQMSIEGVDPTILAEYKAVLEEEVDSDGLESSLDLVREKVEGIGEGFDDALGDGLTGLLRDGEFNFQKFGDSIADMMAKTVSDILMEIAKINLVEALGAGDSSSSIGGILGQAIMGIGGAALGSMNFGGSSVSAGLFDNISANSISTGAPPVDTSTYGGLFDNISSNSISTGFSNDRLFAEGGISDKPAIFGEAGPEAAVPLPDGRSIPVDLKGAGSSNTSTVNVTVNVDSQGGMSEEGAGGPGNQLGASIARAVQSEIINQQRPGGSLARR